MDKPIVSQAGDGEGLRERQKQKERHQGQAQLVYHSSLKRGGQSQCHRSEDASRGRQCGEGYTSNKAVPTAAWAISLGVAMGALP